MLLKPYLKGIGKSFHLTMTLAFGILIITMLIILTHISETISYKAQKKESAKSMLLVVEQTALRVNNQIIARKLLLQEIASNDIIRGKYGARDATMSEKLEHLSQSFDRIKNFGFIRLGIVDKNGIVTYNTGERVDISDRPYIKTVFIEGKTFVTSTIIEKPNHDLVILYATPIRHHTTHEIIGILTGVIDAKIFSDSIASVTYKNYGYGIAIDKTGKTIAHKEYDKRVFREENIFKQHPPSLQPLITIITNMVEGREGTGEYTFEGIKKLIAYAPIKETGYSVAIVAPESEVYKEAEKESNVLRTISLLIIILSTIMVYFISKRIVQVKEKASNEKKHHKQWLKSIVENSPLGIVFTDRQGKIEYVNPTFTLMTGYTLKESIGNNPNILKSGIQNKSFYANMWQTIGKGKVWHGELANRRKDGTTYWEEMYVAPVIDEKGVITNFVASKKDITEQKRLDNELLQANAELNTLTQKLQERKKSLEKNNEILSMRVKKESAEIIEKEKLLMQQSKMAAMGEMVGMIAHQWRQPLNALSAATIKVSILNELGTLSSEELNTTLKFIQDMSQKMSATIKDFMEFAKPDRNKEPIPIKNVVNDTLSIMDAQLTMRNIGLQINIEPELQLHGYHKELSHVLLNCLSNAKDAFENKEIADKKITIRAYEEGECVVIQIGDNAGGIEGSIIDRVFDPFFTTKSEYQGTGLGLYMSKKIIEEHFRGSIHVTNTDNGAIFTIELPKF